MIKPPAASQRFAAPSVLVEIARAVRAQRHQRSGGDGEGVPTEGARVRELLEVEEVQRRVAPTREKMRTVNGHVVDTRPTVEALLSLMALEGADALPALERP